MSPKQSGAVRVSVSLAAAAICRPVAFEATGGYGAAFAVACVFLLCASVVALKIDTGARLSS